MPNRKKSVVPKVRELPGQKRKEVDTVKEYVKEKSAQFLREQVVRSLERAAKKKVTPHQVLDSFMFAADTHIIDLLPLDAKKKALAKKVVEHDSHHIGYAKQANPVFEVGEAISVLEHGLFSFEQLEPERLAELPFNVEKVKDTFRATLVDIKKDAGKFARLDPSIVTSLRLINSRILRQVLGERMTFIFGEISLEAQHAFIPQLNKMIER